MFSWSQPKNERKKKYSNGNKYRSERSPRVHQKQQQQQYNQKMKKTTEREKESKRERSNIDEFIWKNLINSPIPIEFVAN